MDSRPESTVTENSTGIRQTLVFKSSPKGWPAGARKQSQSTTLCWGRHTAHHPILLWLLLTQWQGPRLGVERETQEIPTVVDKCLDAHRHELVFRPDSFLRCSPNHTASQGTWSVPGLSTAPRKQGTLGRLRPAYNLYVWGRSYPVHKLHKALLKELKFTERDILPNEGYDLIGSHKIRLLGQDGDFLFNKVETK